MSSQFHSHKQLGVEAVHSMEMILDAWARNVCVWSDAMRVSKWTVLPFSPFSSLHFVVSVFGKCLKINRKSFSSISFIQVLVNQAKVQSLNKWSKCVNKNRCNLNFHKRHARAKRRKSKTKKGGHPSSFPHSNPSSSSSSTYDLWHTVDCVINDRFNHRRNTPWNGIFMQTNGALWHTVIFIHYTRPGSHQLSHQPLVP